MALGPIVAAGLKRDSHAPLPHQGPMEQVATPSGGTAMSRLMKAFATVALIFSLIAITPVSAEARWGGGWHGGGWHGGGWRGGGWGGWRGGRWRGGGGGLGPAFARGLASPAGLGRGARHSPWASLPRLPGASDPAGAGVRVGGIPTGMRAGRAAAGCLFASGDSGVRWCVPSGAAGDPGLTARTLLLRRGLRTPAVRVGEKPIEPSQRQEQSAKAE